MYESMARKQLAPGGLLLCLLLAAAPLSGLEKTIELGKESLWSRMTAMDGVTALPGRWGFNDLLLGSSAYTPDSSTEFLLHFDSASPSEAAGEYALADGTPAVSLSVSAIGSGSAAFTGNRQGVSWQAPAGGMFSIAAVWQDFTIEFWMYPATLGDGETLISWTGSARDGASAGRLNQAFLCFIRDRRLVWDFQNLFTLPSAPAPQRIPVTLTGSRQLLPRTWHHHLLRFDSRTGLLEYQLDGAPEAIVHVTDTGSENGSVAVPVTGTAFAGPVQLGAGFTGFLDELRVSRRFVTDPVLTRFLGRTGTAVSAIIDLGWSSTRVTRIDAVIITPSDSGVQFFYQAAEVWNGRRLLKGDTDWIPFTPGADLRDSVKTRYIQLRVEMFPDGTRTKSPRLSSLAIVYEPNLPPAPPAGVTAAAGNGKVTLTWRKANDLNVKGYLVYYGGAPHTYLGTGARPGDSPVDAGAATSVVIESLDNGASYYFAVTAYDDSTPRQQSSFSPEVSARPSRIYK
jgi:hypothetical protein